jgi:hypothetical protein
LTLAGDEAWAFNLSSRFRDAALEVDEDDVSFVNGSEHFGSEE